MLRAIQGFGAVVFAWMCLALGGCNSGSAVVDSTQGFPAGTGFQIFSVNVDGSAHKYSVFIPRDYTPAKRYPTIVFLHGMLEAGDDATKNLGVGIGPHVKDQAATWPFITIFPQSSNDWQSEERQHLCIAALDDVSKRYSVDPDRVILTGLSNGGQGCWIIGGNYRNRFAALVPIAGHSATDYVPKLTGIPIRCYHNSLDPFVPSSGASDMCERINKAGGNAKYVQFGAFGHNCWDDVYSDGEVIQWMLAQHRNGTAAAPRSTGTGASLGGGVGVP